MPGEAAAMTTTSAAPMVDAGGNSPGGRACSNQKPRGAGARQTPKSAGGCAVCAHAGEAREDLCGSARAWRAG